MFMECRVFIGCNFLKFHFVLSAERIHVHGHYILAFNVVLLSCPSLWYV
jgi:hypothetical protein